MKECPLLGHINVEPFLHTNIALAPNRSLVPDQEKEMSFVQKYGRASLGFGASLIMKGIAIECYYNPLVYS